MNIYDVPDTGRVTCIVKNEVMPIYKHFRIAACIKNIIILILQHFQHIHYSLQTHTTTFLRL
jgi:hypothetical protein